MTASQVYFMNIQSAYSLTEQTWVLCAGNSCVSCAEATVPAAKGSTLTTRLNTITKARISARIDTTNFLFILFSSDLEIIPDSYRTAECADYNADSHKHTQHERPKLRERNDLNERYCKA